MRREADVRLVAKRRYWREAEARVVVEAFWRSGETLSGFARRHGLKRGRLSRWVERLGEGEESLRFHPVRLVEDRGASGGGAAIEIELLGGQRVRVPRGFESEELRRVLAVLEVAGSC